MVRRIQSLTPLLVLACAGSGAWASKKAFNIHDDLLAYPQFQVFFPDEYILDTRARELLQNQQESSSTSADKTFAEGNDAQVYLGGRKDKSEDDDKEALEGPGFTYEEMLLDGQRYLCSIPQVDNEDKNQTNGAESTSKEDEQREIARATDRGLELLREMEGKCMYYISGWWSYSFCYKKQIKQFHALPSGPGVPNYPPIEDSATHAFVLGRFPNSGDEDLEGDAEHKKTTTDVAELQTKGGSRYLCDLTGKDRKIEVQFHCHPQSTDRIGWIKELTTCSYLMVIYTPRLCNDVAFLPPQQDEAHAIECREILSEEEVPDWEASREYQLAQQLVESAITSEFPVVGDIEVGAHKWVGSEGKQIEKGRVASIGEEKIEVVAKRQNGKITRLSKEELKKYGLDPEKIETLKSRLEEAAKGKDWTLEIVESNGERGLVGTIDPDDGEKKDQAAQGSTSQPAQETTADKAESNAETGEEKKKADEKIDHQEPEESGPTTNDADDGSEEIFFKDEL
ncbi:PRKCSH domain-containing protein [Aspergillus novofumigatus IBT 16806]|uniref:Endoplasmic reticulum lectin n=1 Tax=Aspergillus novofumigatus (strain IBT 16806) TaxID=1392255 RepID=A0A2I1C017_ASPN1|nr:putative misfolded glyco proteins degradation protein Yos9 [Aspergillus novofumigatus IBT 16806]PKX90964.1 putative misfolded glyco proteins degradation protein Yos9 [Aspergillus novofumigatus IBT 16806]